MQSVMQFIDKHELHAIDTKLF